MNHHVSAEHDAFTDHGAVVNDDVPAEHDAGADAYTLTEQQPGST